jgi:hypothetical protein
VTGAGWINLNGNVSNIFALSNNALITFPAGLGKYQASIKQESLTTLPITPPRGSTFIDGLTINFGQKGRVLETLPNHSQMTISFPIPPGKEEDQFTILYWNGNEWMRMDTVVTNGRVETTTSVSGTYVLVIQ